jgi:CheY-like chemotaxis protein
LVTGRRLQLEETRSSVTSKVLIVDDSKLARMSVAKVLKTLHPDWQIVEANDAAQALASVNNDQPQFALLDYNMPGKDGLALAAELGLLHPRIGIAVISANHQLEVIERARAVGATFIRKPLTENALADFLTAAADQDKPAQ